MHDEIKTKIIYLLQQTEDNFAVIDSSLVKSRLLLGDLSKLIDIEPQETAVDIRATVRDTIEGIRETIASDRYPVPAPIAVVVDPHVEKLHSIMNGQLFDDAPTVSTTEALLTNIERLTDATADRMNRSHPPMRRCGRQRAKQLLKGILRKNNIKTGQIGFYLAALEDRHRRWLATDQWTREGGQFSPGLDTWLNYEKRRYEQDPPEAAYATVNRSMIL